MLAKKMNSRNDPEEWMLMNQRQRKPRSQSLPQAAVGFEIGQCGTKSSRRVAHYVNKIPQLVNLNHQNRPCEKLDSNPILFEESPSPELRRKTKKGESEGRRTRQRQFLDLNLLSNVKDGDSGKYNKSTLQVPDTGNSNNIRRK